MKFARVTGLNEKALSVKIAGNHIGEITKKSIDDCYAWFNKIQKISQIMKIKLLKV